MILHYEIKLKLGDAWTAYDRMATADALIKKIKYLLNQDCKKSKEQMELLSINGQIAPQSEGGDWGNEVHKKGPSCGSISVDSRSSQ